MIIKWACCPVFGWAQPRVPRKDVEWWAPLVLVEFTTAPDAHSNPSPPFCNLIWDFLVSWSILGRNLSYRVCPASYSRSKLSASLFRLFSNPFFDEPPPLSSLRFWKDRVHPMGTKCYRVFISRSNPRSCPLGICYVFLSALIESLRTFYLLPL